MPATSSKLNTLEATLIDTAIELVTHDPRALLNDSDLAQINCGSSVVGVLTSLLSTRQRMDEVHTGVRFSRGTLELVQSMLRSELGLTPSMTETSDVQVHTALDEIERAIAVVNAHDAINATKEIR